MVEDMVCKEAPEGRTQANAAISVESQRELPKEPEGIGMISASVTLLFVHRKCHLKQRSDKISP